MRIGLFTDVFYPQINGVVTATDMLAGELARKGHEVHVLAPEFKDYHDDTSHPYIVKRFPSIPAFFYEEFRLVLSPNPSILSYASKNNFDIYQFTTPLALGFESILLSRIFNKPLVGTFHTFFADPDYLKHIKLDNKLIEQIGWAYSNFFYNRVDVVTVPSQQTAVEIKAHGCKPPIRYISNGIVLSEFDNSKSPEVRSTFGIQDDDIGCLFVGRLAYEKNIDGLIRAFAASHRLDDRLKLLIVGGGPQEQDFKALVDRLNAGSFIKFVGRVAHDELLKSGVYGACPFFITLSKTENQPVTILEAQANGCITVCLPEKGLKTMIEHRKTGYFVSSDKPETFADEFLQLLANSSLQTSMRKHIKHHISEQSIDRIGEQWIELYSGLILKRETKGPFRYWLHRTTRSARRAGTRLNAFLRKLFAR